MQIIQAIVSSVSAGLIHVLLGPDHIGTIITICIGQGKNAFWYGLRWGLGHSLGLLIIGLFYFITSANSSENVQIITNSIVNVLASASMIIFGLFYFIKSCKRYKEKLQENFILPKINCDNIEELHSLSNCYIDDAKLKYFSDSPTDDHSLYRINVKDYPMQNNYSLNANKGNPCVVGKMRNSCLSDNSEVENSRRHILVKDIESACTSPYRQINDEKMSTSSNSKETNTYSNFGRITTNSNSEQSYNESLEIEISNDNNLNSDIKSTKSTECILSSSTNTIETTQSKKTVPSKIISLLFGVLHGIAGPGGFLGIIPASKFVFLSEKILFLLSFLASSTFCMALFAYLWGSCTINIKNQRIFFIFELLSSSICICVGIVWLLA